MPAEKVRMLFIGNSLSARNHLPDLAASAFYAALFKGRARSIPAIEIDLSTDVVSALHESALAAVRGNGR